MPTLYKKFPEDRSQDIGTNGILLPTNNNRNKAGLFSTSRSTEQQAVTNYINLLLTFKGERVMYPEYGIGIQNYLFENNTEALRTEIEFQIQTQSAFWLPYIVNHRIDVRPRADIPGLNADPENAIQIVITFSVTESGANQQIVIFQNAGRTNVTVG